MRYGPSNSDRINRINRIEADGLNPVNPVNPVKMVLVLLAVVVCAGFAARQTNSGSVGSPFALASWELAPGSEESVWGAGGVQLGRKDKPSVAMFLWLYEWNLFDAVDKGEHTHGTVLPKRAISVDQEEAAVSSAGIEFRLRAVEDGATVQLIIINRSDHDWPPLAAIIPCFNPGPAALRSSGLGDDEHRRTYFLGSEGLVPLGTREIHFRRELRPLIDRLSPSRQFVFSHKWPTSSDNAAGGILIRESEDGHWVTGIAWEDYVAVQGHNPWKCLHVALRVGPLARGETKTVRGRIYLFPGNRSDCLTKYRKDFP